MGELRRKFYDYLVSWKASKRQECLLIKGARQVGKTYIVEKFGREHYESFIEPKFGSRGFRYCRIANEPVAFPVTDFVRSET